MTHTNTDLIIIGGGAAGFMAGVTAGERRIRAVVLERCPKPGRKLLMCGNNRCNLTSALSAEEMLADIGEPVAPFLQPALSAFPPAALREWFQGYQLQTKIQRDKRVYPASEKAADVHHCFMDQLAKYNISIALNSPVHNIVPQPSGVLLVQTNNLELTAKCVLLATGGVSYPRTGSVGDGQKMASALGHKVTPYRPGLAGFDMPRAWIAANPVRTIPNVTLRIMVDGQCVATTQGFLEIEKYGIGGPAVTDASRIIARRSLKNYTFEVNVAGQSWTLKPQSVRPLKEAMVTVGGVALNEINPHTMESNKVPGLFFAGEVMDIDGPTGGYNLQAAFSTSRLAMAAIAKKLGAPEAPVKPLRPQRSQPTQRPSRPPHTKRSQPPKRKRRY